MTCSIAQFVASIAFVAVLPIHAQEQKKGQPENTIAVMSEEVVRQRLQTLGHKEISNLKTFDNKYQAVTVYNGKKVLIEVDGVSGEVKEKAADGDKSLPR